MIKKVYFVKNLHGIRYFLSLYEPSDEHLIIVGKNASLQQFLREILPYENKIPIGNLRLTPYSSLTESLNSTPRSLPSRWLRRMYYLFVPIYQACHVLLSRIYYASLLRGIKAPAEAYLFSKSGSLEFLVMASCLRKKGIDIRFVDAISEGFYLERVEEQSFLSRFYLWTSSLAAGVKLAMGRARYWQSFELANPILPTVCQPDSWERLAEKYRWTHINGDTDAILLVDGPIQLFRGVNIKDTQENLIGFFAQFLDNGVQIHLKLHYNHPEISSFDGTQLEDKIKKLPAYFPAELIMNHYERVYLFGSSSGSAPIKGKKYSLANLVVFDSEEERDLFRKLYQDSFSKEIGVIEFVAPRQSPCTNKNLRKENT